MNKAATSHFNIRVMECRLAAKVPHGFHQVLMKPSSKYVLATRTPLTPTSCGLILTLGQVLPYRAYLSLQGLDSGHASMMDGNEGWNLVLHVCVSIGTTE